MRTPETAGFEPATEQALGLLFVSAAAWLDNNAPFDIGMGNRILDIEDDGLLVTDFGPGFRFVANAEVLRELLPEEAETLELGGNLGLAYVTHHYSYAHDTEELLYVPPTCQFRVSKADDPSRPETLYVELAIRDGNLLGIDYRYRESAMPRVAATEGQTVEEWWNPSVEANHLKGQLGLDDISRNECAALQSIVNHLDIIAQRQVGRDQTEP